MNVIGTVICFAWLPFLVIVAISVDAIREYSVNDIRDFPSAFFGTIGDIWQETFGR